MNAPTPSSERCPYSSSTPPEPPLLPNIAWKERVRMNHGCSSCPRLPSGFSRLCSGPAPKPSSETEKPATRTFVITPLSDCDLQSVAWVAPLILYCKQFIGAYDERPPLGVSYQPDVGDARRPVEP